VCELRLAGENPADEGDFSGSDCPATNGAKTVRGAVHGGDLNVLYPGIDGIAVDRIIEQQRRHLFSEDLLEFPIKLYT